MRYLTTSEERTQASWVQASDSPPLRDRSSGGRPTWHAAVAAPRSAVRSIWSVDTGFARSPYPRRAAPVLREQSRCEDLEHPCAEAVASVHGRRSCTTGGVPSTTRQHGTTFPPSLHQRGEAIRPDLYSHYVDIRSHRVNWRNYSNPISLDRHPKFMPAGLAILDLDAASTCRRAMVRCQPVSGSTSRTRTVLSVVSLLADFGGSPYGYSGRVIKACLAGLLRARAISHSTGCWTDITSIARSRADADMFTKDRDFRRRTSCHPRPGYYSA